MRPLRLAPLAVLLSTLCAPVSGEAGIREARFDLYAFSQDDVPGQEFKNEGLSYVGARPAATVDLTPSMTLRVNAAVSLLRNEEAAVLPPSTGATVTSASSRVVAFDLSAGLEIRRPGSAWTFRPGAYYHHQVGYVAEGIDLGVERELSGGDTVLSATFNQRVAFPKLRTWRGFDFGRDIAATHSLTVGWKQNLSPAWVGYAALQFTRADGFLGDSYNYVVLFDGSGPIAVVDEAVPDSRNRFQLNWRLRWSPSVGTALGLDTSYYLDSWDVTHVALEPSVVLPLPGRGRGRVWYRLSDQNETEHFAAAPTTRERYRTQDSDLGSFTNHGGGAAVSLPWGRDGRREWRLSVFGFDRSDGMRAAGGDVGVVRKW